MLAQRVPVPGAFNWLFLSHIPVAIVAVFAAVYVFGADTVPHILAVISTVLHVLLGLYLCLARIRGPACHIYVVSPWLVLCAGLWCAPLYFFARCVSGQEQAWLRQRAGRPLFSPLSKAGCAMSAWSVFIDLVLLGLLLLRTSKPEPDANQDPYDKSSLATTADTAPRLPPLAYLHNHRISLPYPPTSPTLPHSPTPISSPVFHTTPSHSQPKTNPSTWTRHHHNHEANNHPLTPAQNHHDYDPTNRISLLLHLCTLQTLPQGNFPYTPELGTLLNAWARRDIVMAPTPHGLTALAHACMVDITHTIWTAQREGREGEVLSAQEMRSLERVGWDLGWVWGRIEAAGGWLREQRGGGR